MTGEQPPCDLYLSSNVPGNNGSNWISIIDGQTRTFFGWGGQNETGFVNSNYDTACINALNARPWQQDYVKEHKNAQKIFTEQLPVIPLFPRMYYGYVATEFTKFDLDITSIPLWNIEEISFGVTTSIPQSGGTLTSEEDTTSYNFAAGTFAEPVTVTHVTLSPLDVPDFKPLIGAGHFFEVGALNESGQSVSPIKPYDLIIEYTDGENDKAIETTISLYYWDDALSQWVKEPSTKVFPTENKITARPDHFSIWAVLADTRLIYLPMTQK